MSTSIELPPPGGRRLVRCGAASPRGVIVSLATGRHRELLAESAPTLVAYGRRHGWDVVLSSESPQGDRPPSWAKVVMVRRLMQQYPFVFWVDADAIIVDLERDLLAEIDPDGAGADADIWFARHAQERNPDNTAINAGVLLTRSSAFADALLSAAWHAEEFIEHNWWEQAALLDILGYSLHPPFAQHTVTVWNERVGEMDLSWNSVPGYCESPTAALNHHARSDHDDFALRVRSMADDRRRAEALYPQSFAAVGAAPQSRPRKRLAQVLRRRSDR